jgi:hypothetical protein
MARKEGALLKIVLLPLAVAWLAGCVHPSVYTNRHTTQPVMLGPVKNLRAQQPPPPGPVVESFEKQVENYYFFYNVDAQGAQTEGSTYFDIAMNEAGARCPQCTLRMHRLEVGSWFMFSFLLAEKNWAIALATTNGPVR